MWVGVWTWFLQLAIYSNIVAIWLSRRLAALQSKKTKSTLSVEIWKLKRHQKIEAPQKIPCHKNYKIPQKPAKIPSIKASKNEEYGSLARASLRTCERTSSVNLRPSRTARIGPQSVRTFEVWTQIDCPLRKIDLSRSASFEWSTHIMQFVLHRHSTFYFT